MLTILVPYHGAHTHVASSRLMWANNPSSVLFAIPSLVSPEAQYNIGNTEHSVAAAPITGSPTLRLPVSMASLLSLPLLSLRPHPCPLLVGANHTSARFCSR